MSIDIQKAAIDIGIVTTNIDAMMKFYRDDLGLELEGAVPMPGGGTMNRFKVGDTIVKVIDMDPAPAGVAAPGGIRGATGYRYWTITVANLEEVVTGLGDAGHKVIMGSTEIRPGISIGIVADPDGNWVEFLQND